MSLLERGNSRLLHVQRGARQRRSIMQIVAGADHGCEKTSGELPKAPPSHQPSTPMSALSYVTRSTGAACLPRPDGIMFPHSSRTRRGPSTQRVVPGINNEVVAVRFRIAVLVGEILLEETPERRRRRAVREGHRVGDNGDAEFVVSDVRRPRCSLKAIHIGSGDSRPP